MLGLSSPSRAVTAPALGYRQHLASHRVTRLTSSPSKPHKGARSGRELTDSRLPRVYYLGGCVDISLLDDKLLEGRGQIQSPLSPWEGPAHRGDPTNVCWPTRDRNRPNSESLGYLPASRHRTATASSCSEDSRGHVPPGHQSSKNPDIETCTAL